LGWGKEFVLQRVLSSILDVYIMITNYGDIYRVMFPMSIGWIVPILDFALTLFSFGALTDEIFLITIFNFFFILN